jgi:hypothetical protein
VLGKQNKYNHQEGENEGPNKRRKNELVEFLHDGISSLNGSKITPKIGAEFTGLKNLQI